MGPNHDEKLSLRDGVQAIEADETASLPHVALCISTGRLALFSENKAKVGPHPAVSVHPHTHFNFLKLDSDIL
jgi:hypothetical protein